MIWVWGVAAGAEGGGDARRQQVADQLEKAQRLLDMTDADHRVEHAIIGGCVGHVPLLFGLDPIYP